MLKHNGDYYCLNYFHSFITKNKLESHKKVCENKDFCKVVMPFKDSKILKFNQNSKSDKEAFIIYADRKSLIVMIDGCNKSE